MATRELVVVLRPDSVSGGNFIAEDPAATAEGRALSDLLGSAGARMRPTFEFAGAPAAKAVGGSARLRSLMADMTAFYSVVVDGAKAEHLVERLRSSALVEAAFLKPPVELPIAPPRFVARQPPPGPPIVATRGPEQLRAVIAAQAATPVPSFLVNDFRHRQGYLSAAPEGVDVRAAWSVHGGAGDGVRIIDIEGGWCFSHVELRENGGGLIAGVPYDDLYWRNHGTAVLGEICGHESGFGIVGIAPRASVSAISHGGWNSARAIQHAADQLGRGDILLLEMHLPGPRHGFQYREDQLGYIPVEWWPDNLLAMQYASERGVIVVEAAGNGAEDLDDPLYDVNPGFGSGWSNPFRAAMGGVDSRAVMVGAGAPPPGTHGRDHGPDRSRIEFSNFGSRVDCQAWGLEVTTTGYGDLFGWGLGEDFWFTDEFGGTSSAAPIVTGVVAALQGVCRARGYFLDSAQVRSLLRTHGAPQQDAPYRPATQRIGLRPDLRSLVYAVLNGM